MNVWKNYNRLQVFKSPVYLPPVYLPCKILFAIFFHVIVYSSSVKLLYEKTTGK